MKDTIDPESAPNASIRCRMIFLCAILISCLLLLVTRAGPPTPASLNVNGGRRLPVCMVAESFMADVPPGWCG